MQEPIVSFLETIWQARVAIRVSTYSQIPHDLFEKFLSRRTRAFEGPTCSASRRTTDLSLLRDRRNQARVLRHKLDELTHTADSRLAAAHPSSFPKTGQHDWS
jgi:hypothetical protein